jgi:hypothetical protein
MIGLLPLPLVYRLHQYVPPPNHCVMPLQTTAGVNIVTGMSVSRGKVGLFILGDGLTVSISDIRTATIFNFCNLSYSLVNAFPDHVGVNILTGMSVSHKKLGPHILNDQTGYFCPRLLDSMEDCLLQFAAVNIVTRMALSPELVCSFQLIVQLHPLQIL